MVYGQKQNLAIDAQGEVIKAPIWDYNEHPADGAFVLAGIPGNAT
jgi:hypothetical protein